MSKITGVKLPKKGEHHNYLIAGDWHTDYLCESTYSIFKKYAKTFPKGNRRLIINGDFLDCVHLMGKPADFKRINKCINSLDDVAEKSEIEFIWANEILDELQKIFDHIYFIEGNHDWRYRNFHDKWSPFAYKHNFDYIKRISLKERGIPVIYYNNWLDIGDKLSITHGMFHSATALKKHYEACQNNVIYSHVHKSESKCFPVRGNTIKAMSLPAMCTLNPDYIKNTDNNWNNGFGEFTMFHDGSFSYHNHDIYNSKLAIQGKIIEG